MKLRYILCTAISIPVFLILLWFFAVPDKLIKERMIDAVAKSGDGSISLSFAGFKKGVFFNIHAENLYLNLDNKRAIHITDFVCNFTPRYLISKQIAFSIAGKIGTGNIDGIVKLPHDSRITVDRVELNAVPYLTGIGIESKGYLSAYITIKKDTANIVFEVPDLGIQDSALTMIPFVDTFRKMQGALAVKGNVIHVDSVSLEGDKGYARLKGDITNGVMNLSLELMPAADKLNTVESMLIGKYIVSPGYYVIPIKGPL